jgi:hypothetical protein
MDAWTLVDAMDNKTGDVSKRLETPPPSEAHNPMIPGALCPP